MRIVDKLLEYYYNKSLKDFKPLIYIVLSASLFGSIIPFAKLLVGNIPPAILASLFY